MSEAIVMPNDEEEDADEGSISSEAPGTTVLHPAELLKTAKTAKERRDLSDEELFDGAVEWLHEEALKYESCPSLCGSLQAKKQCHCMTLFTEGANASVASDVEESSSPLTRSVARWIVYWCRMSAESQSSTVLEWCRHAQGGCTYRLPLLADEEDAELLSDADALRVCRFVLQRITHKGRTYFRTRVKAIQNHTVPGHGLKGKRGNRSAFFDKEIGDDLHLFFHHIKEFAEPVATHFVREKTGKLEVRDKKDDVHLPSHWSKRGLYVQWAEERGWKITFTNTGKTKKEQLSTDDDDNPNGDNEPLPLCSWTAFHTFWKTHYDHVKITKPTKDVCDLCYMFYNKHKYRSQKRTEPTDDDDDDDLDEAAADELADVQVANDDDPFAPDLAMLKTEESIALASKHVVDAKVMRKLANEKVAEAKHDRVNNVSWSLSRDVFVADFCQNLALPHLGSAQAGETYYYSPLGIYCFGVVDVSHEKEQMRAYIYTEGEARKGGNTVASLLLKNLRDLNLIDRSKGPRGELTIIMDNCAGQNKNRMVLRLSMLFVELGYYKKVNFVFFIVGHTKNVADRLFNALKLVYNKENVYNMEQLMTVCNKSSQVTPVRVVVPGDIRDFDGYESRVYKKPPAGTVKKNHVFSSSCSRPGWLTVQETSEHGKSNYLLANQNKDRNDLVNRFKDELPIIPAHGLAPIKQVEMYKKWRKYVPVPMRSDIYKYPGDDVMAKVASERRNSQRKKVAQKRKRPAADSAVASTAASDAASVAMAMAQLAMEPADTPEMAKI